MSEKWEPLFLIQSTLGLACIWEQIQNDLEFDPSLHMSTASSSTIDHARSRRRRRTECTNCQDLGWTVDTCNLGYFQSCPFCSTEIIFFGGRYQIIRQLGKGAFSTTYLVKDRYLSSSTISNKDQTIVVRALKIYRLGCQAIAENEIKWLTRLNGSDVNGSFGSLQMFDSFAIGGHLVYDSTNYLTNHSTNHLINHSTNNLTNHSTNNLTNNSTNHLTGHPIDNSNALSYQSKQHQTLAAEPAKYQHMCIVMELLSPIASSRFQPSTTLLSSPSNFAKNLYEIQRLLYDLSLTLLKLHTLIHRPIHADIKFENILWDPSRQRFKLIDYGNCMEHAERTAYFGSWNVQSLMYRAPEVLAGLPFDQKIDSWSVGIVMVELARLLFFSANDDADNEGGGEGGGNHGGIGGIGGLGSRNGRKFGSHLWSSFDPIEILIEMSNLLGPLPDSFKFGQTVLEANYNDEAKKIPLLSHYNREEQFWIHWKKSNLAVACGVRDWHFLDLLAGLLEFDPIKRFSIDQVLRHPFLASLVPFPIVTGPTNLTSIHSAEHFANKLANGHFTNHDTNNSLIFADNPDSNNSGALTNAISNNHVAVNNTLIPKHHDTNLNLDTRHPPLTYPHASLISPPHSEVNRKTTR